MSAPYMHTAVTLLAAGLTIAVVVCAQILREARAPDKREWPLLKAFLAVAVWASVVWWIHAAHARQHRLYFDEDVYANISHNIIVGYGATLTSSWSGENKETQPYKWPVGFPALAAPAVAWLGTEKGPAVFNEICGALTLAIVMAFATRLASSWLAGSVAVLFYGLHPIVGAWYRSGSAEPLAVLLMSLCMWSAFEHRKEEEAKNPTRNAWLLISLLAALVAMHVRLENALIAAPLSLLLWKPKRMVATWQLVALMLLGAPLVIYFFSHVRSLGSYYLSERPESTFSTTFLAGNLTDNLQFLLKYATWSLLILALAGVVFLAAAKRHAKEFALARAWIALALWAVMSFGVLLFYSVGQYSAPGGSRFLLSPMVVLSLIASASLCNLTTQRTRPLIVAAALTVYLVLLPDKVVTWKTLDAQNRSPRLEHEVVHEWAAEFSAPAIIISRAPYLWENFGAFTVSPEQAHGQQAGATRDRYIHYGLFDQSNELRPERELMVKSAATEHGEIALYRLP